MRDADFSRRLAAAKTEMTAAGLGASSAYPPLFRLLSALGIQLRPPLHHSFAVNFLIQSLFFGISWLGLMYVWIWRSQALPLSIMLFAAVLSGGLFGVFMALYARRQAQRKNLSRWTDL